MLSLDMSSFFMSSFFMSSFFMSSFLVLVFLVFAAFLSFAMSSFFMVSCFMVSCLESSCFMVSWANAVIEIARKHMAISLLTRFFIDSPENEFVGRFGSRAVPRANGMCGKRKGYKDLEANLQ